VISQTLCTSFKQELLLGVHDFRVSGGDTFKIALYTAAANLGADTSQYTSVEECTGAGYVAGGVTLTRLGVATGGTTGFASFSNAAFAGVTLTARGALIYNTTPSANGASGSPLTNPAVCVLDFGEDKAVVADTFTVVFPANDATSAIVRIA